MAENYPFEKRVPVTVIGGYLGAGKTTLVNHLLRNARGRRLAIMVNDFGELPIDADLIEAEDDDVISLTGGCVCCSYGNDLIMAMMEMAKMDPVPDHIILECSGVALPGAIVNSLSLLDGYSVDGVVVLADAETIEERIVDKYMADTIINQLEDADIILLNKTDLILPDKRANVVNTLKKISDDAAVVGTVNSAISPEIILQDFEHSSRQTTTPFVHAKHKSKVTELKLSDSIEPEEYCRNLLRSNPDIVRIKGFARNMEGAMKTIQVVGKRINISHASNDHKAGLVVISVEAGPEELR